MLKYLFLLVLAATYSQNSSASFDFHRNVKAGLEAASNYDEFIEKTVKPTVLEIQNSYLSFPDEVCNEFLEMPITDLINYREVLIRTKESIPCLTYGLNRIDLYYEQFELMNLRFTSPFKLSSHLESSEIVLNKPLALPNEGQLPKAVINLTFDDGPNPIYTPRILRALSDYQIKANFFVLGVNAKKYPDTLKVTESEGQSIGAHSMAHQNYKALSFVSASKDIMDVYDVIESILGSAQPFFRFPYGNKTPRLSQFLKQHNISEFFWNIDSLDWKYKDPNVLLPYVMNHTKNIGRGIALFHDIHPQTAAILPQYLDFLEKSGFSTVVYRSAK